MAVVVVLVVVGLLWLWFRFDLDRSRFFSGVYWVWFGLGRVCEVELCFGLVGLGWGRREGGGVCIAACCCCCFWLALCLFMSRAPCSSIIIGTVTQDFVAGENGTLRFFFFFFFFFGR